ncbi:MULTISPECIES: DUF1289 domain-containing protein [unclassified Pseudomonas]|uniref:DUF1289 domain-containing protein n=1 Tax=unclassified Pseudomonas TaxID=196821 RepID=UPI0030DA917A
MSNQTIKTPCVGLCSTVYGDLVCRGCKRFHHEVIQWNGYNEEEKRAVWLRLEQLLVQVMAGKLEVFDPKTLRGQLEQRKIRFVPHQSEYCWAYQLIARGARVISNVEAYGMVLLPEFRDWPLPDLRDAIDREFFILSEAHYQRYIAPSFLKDAFSSG